MTNPDWTTIAAWASGIATVLASIVVSAWLAIKKAMSVAATAPVPVQKTEIITADTVAMQRLETKLEGLQDTVEALNTTATEIAMILRQEIDERKIDERIDAKVDERVERRLEARAAVRASRRTEER